MPVCYISLGGNLGSVEQTFDSALEILRNDGRVEVTKVSSRFRTAGIGDRSGDDFLNAAAEILTELTPLGLLHLLQTIENNLGRTREVVWGPRTIDLDILFYGSQRVTMPALIIPHPHCWYRRFVLDPLVEIAPDFEHPVIGKTITVIREKLLLRPLLVGLAANSKAEIQRLDIMVREFPEVEPVKNKVPALFSVAFRDAIFKITLEDGVAGIISPKLPGGKVPNFQQTPVETYIRNTLRAALGI